MTKMGVVEKIIIVIWALGGITMGAAGFYLAAVPFFPTLPPVIFWSLLGAGAAFLALDIFIVSVAAIVRVLQGKDLI